jgi:NAD(P)-dependent dehydrogenase (short-subunit alcohol dehydrogenase family)
MGISSFEGKVAFVTGGASGIGLGISRELVRRGALVVLADLRQDHIDDALAQFSGAERSNAVSAINLDVTSRDKYAEAAQRMQDEFGGVDILVNNAGVGLEGPAVKATYADFDFGFGVNIGGVINGFVSFLPQMIAHGRGGHIVSTSSIGAEVVTTPNMAIYGASKAAISHYCEAVKPELADHGIGVSILVPGLVRSRIHETHQNRPAHLRAASGFTESEEKLSRRIVSDEWMTRWKWATWSPKASWPTPLISSRMGFERTRCANGPKPCWRPRPSPGRTNSITPRCNIATDRKRGS